MDLEIISITLDISLCIFYQNSYFNVELLIYFSRSIFTFYIFSFVFLSVSLVDRIINTFRLSLKIYKEFINPWRLHEKVLSNFRKIVLHCSEILFPLHFFSQKNLIFEALSAVFPSPLTKCAEIIFIS